MNWTAKGSLVGAVPSCGILFPGGPPGAEQGLAGFSYSELPSFSGA